MRGVDLTQPVGEDKGRLLGEATGVEDKEELGAVLAEALKGVWDTAGEVPEISFLHFSASVMSVSCCLSKLRSYLEIIDEVAALVVKRCNANLAIEDISPLSLLMPVKLTNDTFIKAHVDRSQLVRGRELPHGRLPGPTTLLNANVRIRKTPLHIRDITGIRARRTHKIWVLPRAVAVPRSKNRSAETIAPGQRVEVIADRINGLVEGVLVIRCVRVLGGALGLGSAVWVAAGVEHLLRKLHAIEKALTRRVVVGDGTGEASASD